MTSTITNTHQWLDLAPGQRVNVTTRNEPMFADAERVNRLTSITVNTIRRWKAVVNAVIAGQRVIPQDMSTRADTDLMIAADGKAVIPPREPLVTVWGKFDLNGQEITVTVHSDTTPQHALDTAWGNVDACNKVREALAKVETPAPLYIPTPDETRRIPQPEKKPDITPPMPIPPPAAQTTNIGQIRHVGTLKKGVEFIDGELVSFEIAKIELSEVNGVKSWKVYNRFGAKPGQYPAGSLTIYGDNDLSMKAVGAALQDLKLQPGGATEGKWTAVYKVRQLGDKTNFYPVQLTA